jgi:maleylacetate reductase
MNAFTYNALPGRVVFGRGTIHRVGDEVAALGAERAMVIIDPSAKRPGELVVEELGRRCVAVFGEVAQHVPEDLAARARAAAQAANADAVVTVGGGSATGLGKAVVLEGGQPLLAVPTTYAGSEMTPIYGITGEHKVTGRDLRALPRVVLYDPDLTVELPPQVAGPSGFNALAHCVEALYAPGTNPIISLMAEAGIRALAASLPQVVNSPDDLEARSEALYGAYLAGAALAVSGTALHHKLGHILGGSFGLVHGDVNAVLLPHVVAYNSEAIPDVMERVAVALGAPEPTEAAGALFDLATKIGAPTSLATIGMPRDGLDWAAERAVEETGSTNPRPVDVVSLRALLDDAYSGRRP